MKKYGVFLLALLLHRHAASAQQTDNQGEVITTQSGQVRGRTIEGLSVFKSIPYAAAPVGNLRFAAPVKHAHWEGIREFVEDGPTAPFNVPEDADIDGSAAMGKGWIKGDEFLTVNVWTPRQRSLPLPVMVYIHGGAFVLGSGNVPLFDGASFAKKGVVLVSLNYRLGIEGFLKIKGVPANIGIRDQIAALRWVKNNITRFGGDTANITLFGESAGAMSVGVLTVSPAAKGLFRRAIMMSGSGQAVLSGEQAGRIANAYAKTLHIKNTREAWLHFTPEQVLAAQPKVTPKMVKLETEEYADPTGGLVLFFPVIDGDIVPDLPLKTLQKNPDRHDMLIGYNSDEVNYFLVPTGLMKKIRLDIILKKAVQVVHPAPSAVIAVYKTAYPQQNRGELFSTILTAYQFQVPSVNYARAHARYAPTFMYEFGWRSPVAGGAYGAYHGIELPFVFNTTDLVKGPRGMLGDQPVPPQLADSVQNAFIRFAATGNPGWEPYTPQDRKTMLIGNQWQLQTNPHQKELRIWDGVR